VIFCIPDFSHFESVDKIVFVLKSEWTSSRGHLVKPFESNNGLIRILNGISLGLPIFRSIPLLSVGPDNRITNRNSFS
jgi:hypothetical protein